MQVPSFGAFVYYQAYPGEAFGDRGVLGEPLLALVVRVNGNKVNLRVFCDSDNILHRVDVSPVSAAGTPHTCYPIPGTEATWQEAQGEYVPQGIPYAGDVPAAFQVSPAVSPSSPAVVLNVGAVPQIFDEATTAQSVLNNVG